MTKIDQERMDVAQAAAERLLRGLRSRTGFPLRGKALKRMKLVEIAVRHLELARLT